MELKIEAIGKNSSGQSKTFILNDYSEVSLFQIIDLIKKKIFNNLIIVSGKHIRAKSNSSVKDNLNCLSITCNEKDFLLFNGRQLILMSINGRLKKLWPAKSGMPGSKPKDQHLKDFGPLPSGEYTANFDETQDYEKKENLWDKIKWLVKSPSWGLVMTPLVPSPKNKMFERGNFYIHGGWFEGTKGCIELQEYNREFHIFARLYKRNLRLVVRYD